MEGNIDTDNPELEEVPPRVVATPERRNKERGELKAHRVPDRMPPPPASLASQIRRSEEQTIADILYELGGSPSVKINITRTRPKLSPRGENIGGSLETVEGTTIVDEEYLRETWGGGDYLIRITKPGENGGQRFAVNKTLHIGGPPKMHGRIVAGMGVTDDALSSPTQSIGGDSAMATMAFETMTDIAREERARADEIRREQPNNRGLDIEALQALNAPVMEQLRTANATVRDLQMKIIELSTKEPPRDEFRDNIMSKMIDGESARIEALRTQYENRIEKLREYHEDQIKRIEDKHEAEIKRLEERQSRELRMMEKAADDRKEQTKTGFDMKIDAKEETIKRLERELGEKTSRIGSLEAKKDQTISEKADELIKVKEALDGIGGGDDDDSDKPWYERLLEVAGNSEAAMALIGKLGGPQQPAKGQPQQGQPQNQLPPPGIPFQTGDGNVYVRDAAGNVTILQNARQRALAERKQARAQKKQVAAQPQQPAPQVQGPPQNAQNAIEEGLADDGDDEEDEVDSDELALELDEKDVKIALTFMENAIKNGTPPEKFAQTARSLVPGDVVSFLQRFGVRKLLTLVKLDNNSPLTTQRGRVFADSVAKILIGDA